VTSLLALAPDWADFLAGGLSPAEHAALREGDHTGRPLGSQRFTAQLERELGRTLARQKPGPKPKTPEGAQS
jgi:putative transposase